MMSNFNTVHDPSAMESAQGLSVERNESLLHSNSTTAGEINKYRVIPEELRQKLWSLHFEKNFDDLLKLLEHIIPLCEDDFEFFFLAGICCKNNKDFSKAMQYFKEALALDSENYAINIEVAKLFADAELYDLADKTYYVCCQLQPERIEGLLGRAEVLIKLEDYQSAKELLNIVIAKDPQLAKAYELLVVCNIRLAEFRKAHETLKYMLSESITLGKTVGNHTSFKQLCHMHRLTTCLELGLVKEVEKSIIEAEKFVETFSDNIALSAEARFQVALANIRIGNVEKGWKHYFYRFDQEEFPSPKRNFTRPRATKLSDLHDKTVLIWREQGVGDEIEFCGLIQEFLSQSGANIILEIDDRLLTTVQKSFPQITVRAPEYDPDTLYSPYHDFDYHMPMADILTFLKPNGKDNNYVKPWLKVDLQKSKVWNKKLPSGGLRIGFAFSSHFTNPKRAKHKHLEFDFFAKLIESSKHTWVNLDYTWTEEEFRSIPHAIKDKIFFPDVDLKNNFVDIAALLSNCDLLLSPYMAIRSLAGAIGVPSASYVRGAPYHFDLGSSLHGKSTFSSPFVPNSRSKQFKDEMDESDFSTLLSEHFETEIARVENLKIADKRNL